METNELKLAWQEMHSKLERTEALLSSQIASTHIKKARHALWPLFVGQVVQVLAGIVAILLGVAAWKPHADVPHVFAAGVTVHVYGVMLIIAAGVMLGKMRGIDYSAPVADIQRRLAELRLLYIRCGMVVGLPWWVLWLPFAMAVFAVVFGVDMYAGMPLAANLTILFGFVGLGATWLFRRWLQNPGRKVLREKLDDGAAGGSLRRARAALDEVTRFQSE